MSEDEISTFEDAEDAGTDAGHLCTLILTDGDTSSLIATLGLSVVGRKQYGMFQLLQYTHEATQNDRLKIPQIHRLVKILGLQYNKEYSTVDQLKSLRYGKLMILTDQNENGSKFKGLVIKFIHENWPHLLRVPFLEEFVTPVVKATKGEVKYSFFSFAEFEEWKTRTSNNHTYNVKYYRGLGTCTRIEAKEYFSDIGRYRVVFKYSGLEDDKNIIKALSSNAVEQRKEWLMQHMDECKRRKALGLQDKYLYTAYTKSVTFSEFINLEYVLFAKFDNERSIPNSVDGFTPRQRKVLYTCIKRNDKREIRVAQLAGSIAELASYHHSEMSLCSTIYKMAQNYIGSNNVNLLLPFGQFGTRLMGGEDSADHYETYTMLSALTRLIFHPHDDPILSYNCDENQKIEPNWYIPIIPMILVNGSEGTGTGWSTKIPNHDPHQLVRCLRKMIVGEEPELLTPYYKNFRGTIEAISGARFVTYGCLAIVQSDKIEITELPIGTWTRSYKENVLEPLLHGTDKKKPVITDYKEYSSDTTVRFVISFATGEFKKLERETGGFYRIFKLCGIIDTSNMHAFDSKNCLQKYQTANDILKEFYDLRLEYYVKRKNYLERKLTAEADKLSNQVKFVIAKSNNTLVVENKTRKEIIDELIELGYQPDPVEEWKQNIGIEQAKDEECAEFNQFSDQLEREKSFQQNVDVKNYDYLLGMSMWMLTQELKNELFKQCIAKVSELNVLKTKSESDLWLTDLEALEKKLNEIEQKEQINDLNTKLGNKDLFPLDYGKNVEFKVTEEFLEKYFSEAIA